MTTARLYYTDAYLTAFDAAVTRSEDGGRRVYLDRTAFYPTSGGQPFDTGELGGVSVIDVVDEGEAIAHLLAAPLAADRTIGQVNWTRRFDHMQQHTGQHLLSAVLADAFGYRTVGVHFGAESSTVDLEGPPLQPDQVTAAESRANALITENRPVDVVFEDAASAGDLRKATTRTGMLRIVTIRDLDRSACGGTHVRATGEIGALLIRKVERVRQAARIEFMCGARAVAAARSDRDILAKIAEEHSSAVADLPAVLAAQRQEQKAAAAGRRQLEARLSELEADRLFAAAVPDGLGVRRIVVREPELSVEAVRATLQALARRSGVLAIAVAGSPAVLMIAAAESTGIDAQATLRAALAGRGRGGGTSRFAQGSAGDETRIDELIAVMSDGSAGR